MRRKQQGQWITTGCADERPTPTFTRSLICAGLPRQAWAASWCTRRRRRSVRLLPRTRVPGHGSTLRAQDRAPPAQLGMPPDGIRPRSGRSSSLGGDQDRLRSSGSPARPNICLLIFLMWLTRPSTGPEFQSRSRSVRCRSSGRVSQTRHNRPHLPRRAVLLACCQRARRSMAPT